MSEFLTDYTGLNEMEPMSRFTGAAASIWAGLRSGVAMDSAENESLFESQFISVADGGNLDAWGIDLGLDRSSGEVDADYRARLLTRYQLVQRIGTAGAIKDICFADASAPTPGLVAFNGRLGPGGAVLAPAGIIHPLSPMGLFGATLFLEPGMDSTTHDALVTDLDNVTFTRDVLLLAEVDGTSVTPIVIDGSAAASSTRTGTYGPALAIDGTLGGAAGYNAFYWDATDVPREDTPPWWNVTLAAPVFADLLMIAQQPRADVNRLRRLRVTVTAPETCRWPGLTYVYEVELFDPGSGNYDRQFFPMQRPTLVSELKIEALSAWPNGLTYHTLAEIELYPPSAWLRNWKRRLHFG